MRDPEALSGRRWDLLVVGGGIHGLFAAYDAAQRGLSVALVEAADFGSGLSFNHQRTLHGGLRAIQTLRLGRAREQIHERRTWARIAPYLIRPLPFLVGTYRTLMRSRTALRLGFRVYNAAGRHRNAGVPAELHLPNTRLESVAATLRLFPGIEPCGLSGGAVWYDYQTVHPDRLTWLVADAARQAGARLVNYLRVLGPIGGGAAIHGVRVRDALTAAEFDIEARMTLLAAGSGIGALQRAFGLGDGPPLVRAMNLLLDRRPFDIALAAPGMSGRMLTAVPWGGGVLVGTHQSAQFVAAEESEAPGAAVEAFLADVRHAFPVLGADAASVRLVHWGLTPGTMVRGRPELLPSARVTVHRGRPGVISLVGVKYTTSRLAAERAIDAVSTALGCSRVRCRTSRTVLPHADLADVEGRLVETQRELQQPLEPDVAAHLAGWYGTEAPAVLRHAVAAGAVGRLHPGSPILEGEISYAVAALAAVRLSDVVLRRTPLGSAGHPGRGALERAAAIMGAELGWSAERQALEVADVEGRYPQGPGSQAQGPSHNRRAPRSNP